MDVRFSRLAYLRSSLLHRDLCPPSSSCFVMVPLPPLKNNNPSSVRDEGVLSVVPPCLRKRSAARGRCNGLARHWLLHSPMKTAAVLGVRRVRSQALCGRRCQGLQPMTLTLWQMTYYSCWSISGNPACQLDFVVCGPSGIRTHDLLNAIETRSQLRHGPFCTVGSHFTAKRGPRQPRWTWRDSNPRPHQCD